MDKDRYIMIEKKLMKREMSEFNEHIAYDYIISR